MIRRGVRRIGPWTTPTMVAVEVVLVWSGWLSFGDAVTVLVAIELLLCIIVAHRMVAAYRRVRAARRDGYDAWRSAEDGLAEIVPRRLAHAILLEPQLWWALARWASRRSESAGGDVPIRRGAATHPVCRSGPGRRRGCRCRTRRGRAHLRHDLGLGVVGDPSVCRRRTSRPSRRIRHAPAFGHSGGGHAARRRVP